MHLLSNSAPAQLYIGNINNYHLMNVNLAYTCSGHPSGESILYPVITRDRMTVLLRSLYGSSPAYMPKREVKLMVHSQLIRIGMLNIYHKATYYSTSACILACMLGPCVSHCACLYVCIHMLFAVCMCVCVCARAYVNVSVIFICDVFVYCIYLYSHVCSYRHSKHECMNILYICIYTKFHVVRINTCKHTHISTYAHTSTHTLCRRPRRKNTHTSNMEWLHVSQLEAI